MNKLDRFERDRGSFYFHGDISPEYATADTLISIGLYDITINRYIILSTQ